MHEFHRHLRRLIRTRLSGWGAGSLALALLAGLAFTVHPIVHHDAGARPTPNSHQSVPDHCTLCQTQHESAPPETPAFTAQEPLPTAPAPLFDQTPVLPEEPLLFSSPPRGPPSRVG